MPKQQTSMNILFTFCASVFLSMFRKLDEVQVALSDSTQKIGKLSENLEREREEKQQELEVILGKHNEDLNSAQERLQEMVWADGDSPHPTV